MHNRSLLAKQEREKNCSWKPRFLFTASHVRSFCISIPNSFFTEYECCHLCHYKAHQIVWVVALLLVCSAHGLFFSCDYFVLELFRWLVTYFCVGCRYLYIRPQDYNTFWIASQPCAIEDARYSCHALGKSMATWTSHSQKLILECIFRLLYTS